MKTDNKSAVTGDFRFTSLLQLLAESQAKQVESGRRFLAFIESQKPRTKAILRMRFGLSENGFNTNGPQASYTVANKFRVTNKYVERISEKARSQ